VGRRRPGHQIGQQAGVLPARRARRCRRRQRQGVSRAPTAKDTKGKGWYKLRHGGRALHRPDQRVRISTRLSNPQASPRSATSSSNGWRRMFAGRSASTPIVLMAHLPLWTIYEQWGWGTADAGPRAWVSEALRFGDRAPTDTIHQIIQKVEGNVTFHTAASTAFSPSPRQVPPPLPAL